MGSTRVFIPDNLRAPENVKQHLKDLENTADSYGHQIVPRPLSDGWIVRIDGENDDDEEMDTIYSSHVMLGVAGPAARVRPLRSPASG